MPGWSRAPRQRCPTWSKHLPADFRLHVNVTAHSLTSGRLVERIEQTVPQALRRHLTIELTERVHVVDMPACVGALQQLRALGIQVALDDFGTGFSSLSHINLLPCDLLKIDRSFVTDVDGDAKRRAAAGLPGRHGAGAGSGRGGRRRGAR